MVHPLVRHQQIFIIMGHSGTIYMGPEITFRHAAQPLMVDFIRNLPYGTVLFQPQNRQLPVMVPGPKQLAVRIVRGHITSSHTVDGTEI